VFAKNSYLHVPKSRIGLALRDARRVLRPGGRLFASVIEGTYEGCALPNDDFPGRWFACWVVAELTAAVSGAGFVAVTVERVPRSDGVNLIVNATAR
jgi:hypothetical protein